MIAHVYNIPFGTNVSDKEKYVLHYENLQLYLRLRLIIKKIHRVLKFNRSLWLITYVKSNTKKKNRIRKNGHKNEKVLYKLMSNVV